jgi:hypothetical protein
MEATMPGKKFFRIMLVICLLVATSLACQLVNNIRQGVEMVSTGQALATDIGGLATQFIPGGMAETAQAMITQVEESGVLETAQSAITEQAPTIQAFVTEVYMDPEKAPPDIPVMEGEKSAFIGTPSAVSYFINAEMAQVVDFYKTEMPLQGWTYLQADSTESDMNTELKFQKGGREAIVMITEVPFVGQTTIVITIEGE